jgi:hypothetical protein
MRYTLVIFMIASVLIWPQQVFGQDKPPVQPKPAAEAGAPPVAPPGDGSAKEACAGDLKGEKSDEIRLHLENVVMARLTQELALDDAQTVLLVRKFSEYREKMRELRKQHRDLLKGMKEMVNTDKENAGIEAKLNEIQAYDMKIAQARQDCFKGLAADMKPWQQAKLYLFMGEVENEMRGLMMKARERERAGKGGPEGAMGAGHGGGRGEGPKNGKGAGNPGR